MNTYLVEVEEGAISVPSLMKTCAAAGYDVYEARLRAALARGGVRDPDRRPAEGRRRVKSFSH